MTTTFENARVGDKVYCLMSGWGKMSGIRDEEDYPLIVSFLCEAKTYTVDGKTCKTDCMPTLYWDKPEIIAPEQPKRTININGYEVPEPEREPLSPNEEYWIAALDSSILLATGVWTNHRVDNQALKRGLLHKTREAAIAHAQALLSFTEQK